MDNSKRGAIRSKGSVSTTFAPGPRASRGSLTGQLEDTGLDLNQDARTVVGEILRNLSRKEGLTKGKRLAYLNAFVHFLQKQQSTANSFKTKYYKGDRDYLGFTTKEICLCLRTSLVSQSQVIRIATLRVLRYLVVKEEDVIALNLTGIPILIVRALDIILNNSGERLQAVRLIQEILTVQNGARHFPMEITRALVAIGFDGLLEKDKLHRASLSILCQLALVRSDQLIQSGGVRILLHNIFSCTSPMVLETIIGSLLHLLNISETRKSVSMNLHSLVAPLTDLHFKHSGVHHETYEKEKEEREIGYKSSKLAIGIVLKSWSGLFSFSSQDNNSGLQALIDALYIEQLEIRRTILDLLCEIFGITFSQWTDEVVVALQQQDPTYSKDNWRLQEGFIVEEALAILPHLSSNTPNITANHMALLVYSFVQKNLLDALVEVIVTSDTFISVRATVLLGEILSLVDHYLPVECFDSSRCIPSLLAHCSNYDLTDVKRHRALEAISVLNSLHKIKSRAKIPETNSLFLSQQLHFAGTKVKGQGKFIDRLGKIQLNRILRKDIESNPSKLLKDSGVLNSKDPLSWSWETILVILRWCPSSLKKVEDSSWRTFLRRLVDFYKLSNNLFARFEFGQEDGTGKLLSSVGIALFQFLSEDTENFTGENLLEEILVDFGLHLDELLRQKNNPFVCFLSPNKLHTTQSQSYFLFIGRMTLSQKGWKILERGEIHKRLLQIVFDVQHETYTKLILSSIYYGNEFSRKILNAALNSQFQGIRLYATKFLRVLLRVKLTDFSKWGIEMLVNQLGDKDKVISLTALDILEESVHDKMYLESLISLRPSLSHFGDRGLLLLITFLSLPSGFKFLLEANFLKKEISKWRSSYNKRYVELVEVLVRDSVSTLRRGEDGLYPERTSKTQEQSYLFQIFVPPHLYGQLAQHKSGFELLIEHADIDYLIEIVKDSYCRNPEETRELKAALWALSHMGASIEAFPLLDERDVLGPMVYLASTCPVLSVRHTVFHCLCLICTTQVGAQALERFGWFAMPRSHHEKYPIWSPPMSQLSCTVDLLSKRLFPDLDEEDEDDILEKSSSTTGSNLMILEEDDDDADQYYLADEVADEEPLTDEKQLNQASGIGRKGSNSGFPTRSLSETQIIPSLSQSLPLSTLNENEKIGTLASSLITRSHSVKRNGSWKWRRKSRSDSVTDSTSGVSSSGGDSANLLFGGRSFPAKTLSPIQSSASIATTTIISNPPSTSSNFSPPSTSKALTDPGSGFSRFSSGGSPLNNYMYRSMIRKPRWPVSQDTTDLLYNDRGRSNSTTNRRLGEENLKSGGSLDRNLSLTPRDLFQESKLMRANSSVTSLSTPSFRLRSESEAKSPCFMGLCLPKSLDMIFLLIETTELDATTSNETNYQSDFNVGASTSAGCGDFIFEFHTASNCLGCMYKESLIEGSLLSGDEPKSLENIVIPPTTSAGLDTSSLISIGSIISGGSSLECKNERRKICPDSFEGKNLIRREIIKLLTSMISCVGSKANEQGLLRLRQKFPKSFQDLCLYSEICGIFSRHNVRLNLRRFFQEVFLDLSFENFYDVSDLILDNFNQLNSFEEQNCCESEVSMSSDTTATSTATTVIEVHRGCPSPNETEPPCDDDDDNSDDQSSEFLDLR